MKKWFAIFKTGKHTDSAGNEREWTESDLDKMVQSYDKTKHEAPIVIGHPKTNAPAFGWIEELKRVGDTLYALPKQLVNEFVEMVNKGLFKKRSISLYPDGTLRHVGFLGAQPPAVKGLPDVEFKEDEQLETIETDAATTDLEDKTDIKELEAEIENYKTQLKVLEQKEEEFEELQTKYLQLTVEKNALEKEIQKQKREAQLKEYNEVVNKAIEEGKLLPKMKDNVLKIFEVLSATKEYEFSEGIKTQPVELIKDFIENMPKIIELGQNRESKDDEKRNEPISKLVADEIRKQME